MRITFVLPFATMAGGTRVVATYARVLSEQGHDVHVLSSSRSGRSRWRNLWFRVTGRKHKVKRMKQSNPLLDVLGDRHRLYDPRKPLDPARVPDADAVFATWWRTADLVNALPASKGKKFYLLQDFEASEPQPVEEVAATYRLPLRKIAVSSYIRDVIIANHGPMQIDVVNNAVDMEQFASPSRFKSDTMTVGFLYKTQVRKQVGLAIEAVRQAREHLPDLRVIAFGAYPPSDRLPLPEWVEFHCAPDQRDIPRLYQSCDLWLFPSAHEGFGLPLLEAMASRTPVVATPAGAAPDLIDGTNGVLLAEGADAEAFCAQILAFARMGNEEWRRFSDAAHATAQCHDWPEATRKLVATVKAGIAQQDARPAP